MSVIFTENLSKRYKGGTLALKNLNLEVRESEVFGFIGPNGSGKSTTIHLLLNFIRPSGGSAQLFGEPVIGARHRKRLGYVPETISLHTYHNGRGLLNFYGQLSGLKSLRLKRRIEEVLQFVGLQNDAKRRVSKYSKGMLQRLGLAQALLHDPELLIFDEPTSNMDPVGRREFRELVLDLKKQGRTVFISSHILSELGAVCDRVAIMQSGELKRLEDLRTWNDVDDSSLEKLFFDTIEQERTDQASSHQSESSDQ
ncbi:MAG: ABC transporter ATP-binding protein [Gammaproteobacteria bacterium]|nr:ABC transporter ATP-binding protein [Gammaproteobacteria bacterium]